jgi:hypothetical protein
MREQLLGPLMMCHFSANVVLIQKSQRCTHKASHAVLGHELFWGTPVLWVDIAWSIQVDVVLVKRSTSGFPDVGTKTTGSTTSVRQRVLTRKRRGSAADRSHDFMVA